MTTITAKDRRVLALALASRLLVLGLMFLSDAAFPDLSSSAHLQAFPCDRDAAACGAGDRGGACSGGTATLLDDMSPWDSVYFVRVAKCGYETDMIHAFFPLLPLAMRWGERLTGENRGLSLLEGRYPVESLYSLVGLAINLVAFCVAALALHRLSVAVLRDEPLADLSVLLFCFNPASVFYSAIYTEALFAACTWTGMSMLEGGAFWAGTAALAAAGAARSNGILGVWFLLHPLARACMLQKRGPQFREAARVAAGCAVVVAPYVAMQYSAYKTFCDSPEAHPDPPGWCRAVLPSVYGHVQKAYWDVGFLKFYTKIERLPRVAQSMPVFYLAVSACLAWAAANWRRAFTLGLLEGDGTQQPRSTRSSARLRSSSSSSTKPSQQQQLGSSPMPEDGSMRPFLGDAVGPYIHHIALMTAAAALVMHVNVATRFLSVCPSFYWYTAGYLSGGGKGRRAWVWGWCLGFIALGCLLFPNFLPWT